MVLPAPSLKRALSGRKSIITYAVMIAYIILPGLIINNKLIFSALGEGSSVFYIFTLVWSLIEGYLRIFRPLELAFYLITAVLLGINVTFIINSLSLLKKQKSLSLSIGGVSLVALVGTGCASCGISLLSLFGVSSAFLPFQGVFLYMFSALLLFFSLIFGEKAYTKACNIR